MLATFNLFKNFFFVFNKIYRTSTWLSNMVFKKKKNYMCVFLRLIYIQYLYKHNTKINTCQYFTN